MLNSLRSKPSDEAYASLLRSAGLSPVLADVGSSGASHRIWQPIASESLVIGFDPDTRNPDKTFGKGYARAILVDKAVSDDDTAATVDFILTEYPGCSSMLEPDIDALSSFSFRDYFRPVNRETVTATSLNRTIESENLEAIHWIKLDSQGADLRLLQSLADRYQNHLMAVDIEPGLIKAYKDEDLFTDCHAWLINEGFWMSRLEYQAYPKIRPGTLADMSNYAGVDPKQLMKQLPKAPTAVEGRYLREVDWLKSTGQKTETLILASVFGLLDGQYGYAYDIASLYIECFGDDLYTQKIMEIALEGIG